MTVKALERRAAIAAFVAASAMVGWNVVSSLLARRDALIALEHAPSPEQWAAWMAVPGALLAVSNAAIPVLGGLLLLSTREGWRPVGAAVVAVFGLLTATHLPLVLRTPPVMGAPELASRALFAGFVGGAVVGGVLAVLALIRTSSVQWRDPRSYDAAAVRLVVPVAVAVAAMMQGAQTQRAVDGPSIWLWGRVLGNLDVWMSGEVVSWLGPPLAMVAAAVFAACARPARIAVGAGLVIAVTETVALIGTPIWAAMSTHVWEQPMQLTIWYGVHVAAVVALAVALALLWRSAEALVPLPRVNERHQ
jgi:hypothetical protein